MLRIMFKQHCISFDVELYVLLKALPPVCMKYTAEVRV